MLTFFHKLLYLVTLQNVAINKHPTVFRRENIAIQTERKFEEQTKQKEYVACFFSINYTTVIRMKRMIRLISIPQPLIDIHVSICSSVCRCIDGDVRLASPNNHENRFSYKYCEVGHLIFAVAYFRSTSINFLLNK